MFKISHRIFEDWFRFYAALAAAGGFLFCPFGISAQTNFFNFSLEQGVVNFTFQTNGSPNGYYVLESSTDLLTLFSPVMISFPSNAPGYQIPATNAQELFSIGDLNIYAPQASLGDGIDDVFKLNLGLNPLSTNVAGSFSGYYGVGGAPLTWLQYYNQVLGRYETNGVAYGREFSVFNDGGPFAKHEAISREVSISLTTTLDAVSREVSVFSSADILNSVDAVSREVSVNNAGQPTANYEAISREVSVFNTAPPTANYEAISREVSAQNTAPN